MKEIKKHFEIEFIKSRSPEEINDMFCQLKEKLESKDKEIAELKEKEQYWIGRLNEANAVIQSDTREISALKEEVERLKKIKEPYIDRDRRTWEDCEYDSNGNHSPDCETCREK